MPDLCAWFEAWVERADCVLALGTSLSGMSADSMSYHNGTKTRTSYAWEIDADGVPPGADPSEAASVRGPRVRSALKIPIPHWSVGKQNGYRVKTWTAIAGESTTDPL